MDDVAKARRGGGARGTTGAVVPRKAPIHTAPKPGSPAWHDSKRSAMARQGEHARAKLSAGNKPPPMRHGGFKCANCGHQDWRLHRVVTAEGKHHETLGFKGCAKCGTMHPTQLHVAKNEGVLVDVTKSIDTTETAVQPGPGNVGGTDVVGHRSNCPRGGDRPCGKAHDGRCGLCNAAVQDHQALGKTIDLTVLELRKRAADLV